MSVFGSIVAVWALLMLPPVGMTVAIKARGRTDSHHWVWVGLVAAAPEPPREDVAANPIFSANAYSGGGSAQRSAATPAASAVSALIIDMLGNPQYLAVQPCSTNHRLWHSARDRAPGGP